ncbi:MAG: hypothetical protein ACLFS7_05965 [Desulfosudaceae bacterium]
MKKFLSHNLWKVSSFSGRSEYLSLLVVFLLPVLLFHFMLPFTDTPISPSRDFTRYYLWQQIENLISVKFGSFPIYIPAVSGGNFCALSAGFGQLYLPLPYLASLLPGYWTGYAFDWVLLLNMLTIILAHLALFLFLRRLGLNRRLSLIFSALTVYTPRILVSFGYGAGIAAWTGHLFLVAAMGLYFLKPTRVKGPLLIIGAAYWLINSGHPAEVYFCMLGAWVFALLLPSVAATVSPLHSRSGQEKRRFWLACFGCCGMAFLLSAAYIMPLYYDVVRNMDYADMSYAQAVTNTDTLSGLLYNFFLPIRAGLFGSFAGTSLYLTVILIPLLKVFRVPVDRGAWLILILIGLVFFYMAGESTPVFGALWQFLPFAANTRNPARASLMLPIVFLLALVWLFKARSEISLTVKGRRRAIPLRSLLAAAASLALVAGVMVLSAISPELSVYARLNALFLPGWVEPLVVATGLLTLLTVVVHGLTIRHKATAEICLGLVICIHLILLMRFASTPLVEKHENDVITLEKIVAQKQRTLKVVPDYLFLFEAASHKAELRQFQNYFVEPHLGQIFREYLPAEDRQEAYRLLNCCRQRDQVVLQDFPAEKFSVPVKADDREKPDRVRLDYSSYNRLVFEAEAGRPAFFVLSYPDPDHQWSARVNGKEVPVYTANGISPAVFIPAGRSTVEFRYWSRAAFAGMVVSCLTLVLLGVLAGIRMRRQPLAGFTVAAAFTCLAIGLFAAWFNSLYTGESFNTRYTWQTPSPKEMSNLAYGKPTEISAYNQVHSPYLHSRRGVDGDRSFYSCFVTAYHRNPWFEIDLQKVSTVGSIDITASLQGNEEDKMILYFKENAAAAGINGIFVFRKVPVPFNRLPLVVAVSGNDRNWEYAPVERLTPGVTQTVRFEDPAEIRYVKIMAAGTCRLSLNEVEVFPPAGRGEQQESLRRSSGVAAP